jgi:hypothetical protein
LSRGLSPDLSAQSLQKSELGKVFRSPIGSLRLLGEPVFLEDFNIPNIVFFIFPDGTEGELMTGWRNCAMHA